jgi:hypothetical protein
VQALVTVLSLESVKEIRETVQWPGGRYEMPDSTASGCWA